MNIPNSAAAGGQVAKLAYSVKEAAQALGVSPTTMRRLLKQGKVPSVHTGGRVLVPVAGLYDFLAQGGQI